MRELQVHSDNWERVLRLFCADEHLRASFPVLVEKIGQYFGPVDLYIRERVSPECGDSWLSLEVQAEGQDEEVGDRFDEEFLYDFSDQLGGLVVFYDYGEPSR